MKRFDIIPGTNGHAFFLGKTDVIACLLFHPRKDFIFRIFYVNNNGARRLNIMRTICETCVFR